MHGQQNVKNKWIQSCLVPLFHHLFPIVVLIEDAVSWLLIPCLSHTRWSICSFTYTHVPLFCLSEHSSLAHLSAHLVELSNNSWTLFVVRAEFSSCCNSQHFFTLSDYLSLSLFWVHSANRIALWDISLFYHCCSENVYQLCKNLDINKER